MFEDKFPTATSKAQNALEKKVLPFYQELEPADADELHDFLELHRDQHIAYLHSGLGQLVAGFAVLDASRTWIVYWLVHSLALLGAPLPRDTSVDDILAFLSTCQHAAGGFGGGPMQLPHLAPTYAAVATAVTLGGKALAMVDRVKMREFLYRMCIPPEQGGGFSVHQGGEGDLRACYTALAVAHMLGMDAEKGPLTEQSNLADYVRACQTYEGGLGGEPGNEAHGGYTFCGVAALLLAGGPSLLAATLDVPRLLHWLVHRQGGMEGGFNGRTNKLVDGCYSFWQGGVFPLLATLPLSALRPQPVPPGLAPRDEPVVPSAPMMSASPPLELAEEDMHGRMQAYESIRSRALAASEEADRALVGAAARHSTGRAAAARELLDQAAVAHEAAELATTQLACVNVSAYAICPPPDPETAAAQEQQHLEAAGGSGGEAGMAGVEGAGGQAAPPAPLCNYEALQLWILKCCQASKGGLRDKPGKPVDYYHTCYCLSGLAAAQHAPGSTLLGPRDLNMLARTDPATNVLDERLAAARAYYGVRPLPAWGEPMVEGG